MIKLTLPNSIRSKKNSKRVYKRSKYTTVLPSKAYLAWEQDARTAAKLELCHFNSPYLNLDLPIKSDIHVKVTAYYKGQQPDLSGVLESIGDCLEGVVWENDRQIKSWDGSRVVHCLAEPRTEVEIREMVSWIKKAPPIAQRGGKWLFGVMTGLR